MDPKPLKPEIQQQLDQILAEHPLDSPGGVATKVRPATDQAGILVAGIILGLSLANFLFKQGGD